MSRIVFLSAAYLGAASANGICAGNIVEALRSMGHDVHVICYEETTAALSLETEKIHTVKKPEPPKSAGVAVEKALRLLHSFITPELNQELIAAYYHTLCRLHTEKPVDAVVAMYFPLESAQALYQFKKAAPEVKTILYELDSVGDGVADFRFRALQEGAYKRWHSRIYRHIDKIVIMQSHKQYWRQTFGDALYKKCMIADIPVLSEKPRGESCGNVSMLYAGLIGKRYRDPSYLLSVLRLLEKSLDYTFEFYSKGDCEQAISEVAQTVKGIHQKGYVPQDELEQGILKADILVSIGNSISRSVPSKIITYLSYGKPIIHFSSQKQDVCNEYFEQYPLALVIEQSMPVEQACSRICEFVRQTRGKTLPFEQVKLRFPKNDPVFSARAIAAYVEEKDTRVLAE